MFRKIFDILPIGCQGNCCYIKLIVKNSRYKSKLHAIPTKFTTSVGSFIVIAPNDPKLTQYVNAFPNASVLSCEVYQYV